MEFKSHDQIDQKKLLQENIKMCQKLIFQYKKELADARAGTGLCRGMEDYLRKQIAKELESHIESNENAIKTYEQQLKEME